MLTYSKPINIYTQFVELIKTFHMNYNIVPNDEYQ
jgi:hypothetical protein